MGGSGQAALLDENKVRALESAAAQRPQDVAVRTELGNMYFDASATPTRSSGTSSRSRSSRRTSTSAPTLA